MAYSDRPTPILPQAKFIVVGKPENTLLVYLERPRYLACQTTRNCQKKLTQLGQGNYKYCSKHCKNICSLLRSRDRSNSNISQKRQRTESEKDFRKMAPEDFISIIQELEAENVELNETKS
ncbi:Uncharacterized protein APZ42_000849, partial [Daphnia magna]